MTNFSIDNNHKKRGDAAVISLMLCGLFAWAILYTLSFGIERKKSLEIMKSIQKKVEIKHKEGGRNQSSFRIPFTHSPTKKMIEHPVYLDFRPQGSGRRF